MNRRSLLKSGLIVGLGAMISPSMYGRKSASRGNSHAKNIIIIVSDGMSSGTLNMSDIYCQRKLGRGSHWLDLYRQSRVTRALMDMASASSIITDSAAASSSWGSGFRVKNGSLNIGVNGEEYKPIWQKMKQAGKMAGCVTTVPICHATPAGFCIAQKSRNDMDNIAELYLDQKFDIMMGGGHKYFGADMRKDKRDFYELYKKAGYTVVRTRDEMLKAKLDKPILGVFDIEGLPYSVDRSSSPELIAKVPTLAEMTRKAIDKMKNHPNGFVLQVEGGKVDWAAHANDISALLYDQLAVDEAIEVAIDYAQNDQNTLVIITSDHGNANPGLIYGKNANDHFDNLFKFKMSNDALLQSFDANVTASQIIEKIEYANGVAIPIEDAQNLQKFYQGIEKEEEGLYNYKKLPFIELAKIQKKYTSVGWISNDHSADYTELAMFGPCSENLPGFIANTDLHYFMLDAVGIEYQK